jgi:hypothetical protein
MRNAKLMAVFLAGLGLAGCATTARTKSSSVAKSSIDEREDGRTQPATQPESGLRIVERRPPPRLYKFVGLVRATSVSGDLVEAARDADADLRRQAARLHADVVKLDVIAPPNDNRQHRHLIFAGRAYKSIARN